MRKPLFSLAYTASFLAILTVLGAISLNLISVSGPSWISALTGEPLSVIQVSLLFSGSFILMSGYGLTMIAAFFMYGRWKSWETRACINTFLFALHFLVFWLLFASSLLLTDLLLLALGLVCVVLAEFSTDRMWRGFPLSRGS